MNLIKKIRIGSKVKKKYDQPTTPYHRVLANPHIPEGKKTVLSQQYLQLNPAELKRKINKLQDRLFNIATNKEHKRKQSAFGGKERKCLKIKNFNYIADEVESIILE